MSGNWYKFFCCGFFFVNVRVFGGGDFFWNEIFLFFFTGRFLGV